jgi:hypothetical protein
MDELVGRIAANVGVERPIAVKTIGIILEFMAREGPPEAVQALLERVPGAAAAIETARDEGGLFGGMGGIMGVGARLMGAGLSMPQIQGAAREIIAYAREQVGEEAVARFVDAVPALKQYI